MRRARDAEGEPGLAADADLLFGFAGFVLAMVCLTLPLARGAPGPLEATWRGAPLEIVLADAAGVVVAPEGPDRLEAPLSTAWRDPALAARIGALREAGRQPLLVIAAGGHDAALAFSALAAADGTPSIATVRLPPRPEDCAGTIAGLCARVPRWR